MFNGIVFSTGVVKSVKKHKNNVYITIESNLKFTSRDLGASVCCNGVCLTIIKINKKKIDFYLSTETLKRSNFKFIKIDQIINLEKSISFGQKISGHFTQGHVDTVAYVKKIIIYDKAWLIRLKINNKKLNKFLIEKASITINGVSLTISKVLHNFFEVSIIPHTLKITNLKNLKINDSLNVELDIFSKYIYKYSN
jgi:riboflavin synthase